MLYEEDYVIHYIVAFIFLKSKKQASCANTLVNVEGLSFTCLQRI